MYAIRSYYADILEYLHHLWHHVSHQSANHQYRHDCQQCRIEYSKLYLLPHLLAIFGVIGQTFQNPLQMPGLLAGLHCRAIQFGEYMLEVGKPCGKGMTLSYNFV